MAVVPKFDDANLQALSDILGATDTGLAGSESGRYLRECGFNGSVASFKSKSRQVCCRASRLVKKLMRHNCSTSICRRCAPDSVLGFGVFGGQLSLTGTGGRYLSLGGFSRRENDQ